MELKEILDEIVKKIIHLILAEIKSYFLKIASFYFIYLITTNVNGKRNTRMPNVI